MLSPCISLGVLWAGVQTRGERKVSCVIWELGTWYGISEKIWIPSAYTELRHLTFDTVNALLSDKKGRF